MKVFRESQDLLETVISGAEENNESARVVAADLTEAQLNWKPSSDQWSIAQCLEHLAVATRGFDQYFAAALERGKNRSPVSNPPYKPSMMGGWLARHVAPEAPRKLRAPKMFRPAEASNIRDSLQMFLAEQNKFIDFVRQCNGVDYNKTRIRSPVTPLMRYSLADAFVITVLHAQRHLEQARRVRESTQFPQT
ncbi:MAG TPA: DinB family protein [Pyrinomonadaceae bacterium]|nr:DinB family protein [Pyrinomonadaceae bacterium]